MNRNDMDFGGLARDLKRAAYNKEEELRSREYIDNDGRYLQYLEERKRIDDKYFQARDKDALDTVPSVAVSDPIVQIVIDKFRTRHFAGMKTYGMTMQDNPASTLEWIQHTQDELMDAILYLERLKQNVK